MNRIVFLSIYIVSCLFLFCLSVNGQAKESFKENDCLVGAYYFDGWAGSNPITNEEWAINAPTHLTKKLSYEYKSRQPVWGWRDDNIKIMERQIKLASSNGIDFFSFCWYWKNDNGRIDTLKIKNHPSIELFKTAGNKHKMRFSLLIANHVGARIKTEKDWLDAVIFWAKHYFNDPQYLKIDGKPVVTIFASGEMNRFIPVIRQYVKEHTNFPDLFIISNKYDKPNSHFDMLSWYNIREREPGHSEKRDYKVLIQYVEKSWAVVGSNFCIAPCVMVNWDCRPWEIKTEGLYYIGRTPDLFRKQLEAAFRFVVKRNQTYRLVMVYAWNELGEGGYLIPTQEDKKAVYLKQVKKAKKRIKHFVISIK